MPSECFKVSNNKYFNCPALMSDGRTFTDYRPNCLVDQSILKENKINSSYEYRQFLMKNASKFIEENSDLNYKKNSCETCNSELIPLKTVCEVDGYTSTCRINDDNGLGMNTVGTSMTQLNYSPALQKSTQTFSNPPGELCNKVIL